LSLLGAATGTGYFLLGQQMRRNLSLMTYSFIVYGISSITLLIYNIALQNTFVSFPKDHWLWFLALAVIATFFGHSLFNWALRWLSTATISIGIVFVSIGATILAYYILCEVVTTSQWLGGTIVNFGLFLFIMSTTRKQKVTISYNDENDV